MVELPTQVTDNQISDIIKSETSLSEETVASISHHLEFVNCGETIKEEIKEENMEFHDPLRLSYAVQSLDEPVTYEDFFVSTEDFQDDSVALLERSVLC